MTDRLPGMLHWSLEDKRCKHLYFLAADLLQYIDELRELQQHSDGDHITLVKQRSPEAGGLEWMYTKLSKFFASECVNTASMVASDMAREKTSAKVQNVSHSTRSVLTRDHTNTSAGWTLWLLQEQQIHYAHPSEVRYGEWFRQIQLEPVSKANRDPGSASSPYPHTYQ
jgi:hypothetical protein